MYRQIFTWNATVYKPWQLLTANFLSASSCSSFFLLSSSSFFLSSSSRSRRASSSARLHSPSHRNQSPIREYIWAQSFVWRTHFLLSSSSCFLLLSSSSFLFLSLSISSWSLRSLAASSSRRRRSRSYIYIHKPMTSSLGEFTQYTIHAKLFINERECYKFSVTWYCLWPDLLWFFSFSLLPLPRSSVAPVEISAPQETLQSVGAGHCTLGLLLTATPLIPRERGEKGWGGGVGKRAGRGRGRDAVRENRRDRGWGWVGGERMRERK